MLGVGAGTGGVMSMGSSRVLQRAGVPHSAAHVLHLERAWEFPTRPGPGLC